MSEDFDGKMRGRGWVVILGAVIAWLTAGGLLVMLMKAVRKLF